MKAAHSEQEIEAAAKALDREGHRLGWFKGYPSLMHMKANDPIAYNEFLDAAAMILRAAVREAPAPTYVFDDLIEQEAAKIADRENTCSGCCGPYGDETAADYRDHVRDVYENVGRAYVRRNLEDGQ